MDSKTMLLVASMLYTVDVSNAFLCYNCTSALNPACGETLGVTTSTSLQQITCPASAMCMVAKTSMNIQGTMMTMFSRSCEQFACNQGCVIMEGVNMCGNCCNTDLCNANFNDPSVGPGPARPGMGGAGAGAGMGGAGAGAGAGGAGAGVGTGGAGTPAANPGPSRSPVKVLTTKSSAINVVVNVATIFLAGLLSTTMF